MADSSHDPAAGPGAQPERSFDILVVSHGQLAAALLEAAVMICGPQPGAVAVEMASHDSPESLAARVTAALRPGRATLILSDLYGGTPHNVAAHLARSRGAPVRVIGGANLALLIEAITTDEPFGHELEAHLVARARAAVVSNGSNGLERGG